MPNLQAAGPPHVGSRRLIIQYIRSYPPYLEAVFSIRTQPEDAPCRVDKGPT
jgi:hypothetical protein